MDQHVLGAAAACAARPRLLPVRVGVVPAGVLRPVASDGRPRHTCRRRHLPRLGRRRLALFREPPAPQALHAGKALGAPPGSIHLSLSLSLYLSIYLSIYVSIYIHR